ncbi:hypothetical protein KBD08_00150 [Candidatus Babeliales bacterium]|nr:hypothetical protein [Candidatus Babeliales bacterium]
MDWRQSGMRPLIDRKRGCRHCPTSGTMKKIHDTMSRVKKHFQDLWSRHIKKS